MKIGRNNPCPCGSGLKYKKCCGAVKKEQQAQKHDLGKSISVAERYYQAGDYRRAESICNQMLAVKPDQPDVLGLKGMIALKFNKKDRAAEIFKSAVTINPNDVILNYLCGRALGDSGRFNQAATYLTKAIDLNPGFAEGYNYLGTIMHVMGRSEDAASLALKAMEMDRNNPQLHSHQLVCSHCSSKYSDSEIFEFHRAWEERYAHCYLDSVTDHANTPEKKRRLKIGYVSPNFNRKIVGYFIKSVFESHDRVNYEVFCYSNTHEQDDLTVYFEGQYNWRDIRGMSDDDVASLVRQDKIDILVDLAGHTPNNRLLVFARKPAPVQVSWLDYFDTTGLKTIDYIISDPVSTPRNTPQKFSEEVMHMPNARLCWSPPEFAPELSDLPALKSGFVTFGSFNRSEKLTGDVVRLWAGVLNAIPQSRLVLKGNSFVYPDVTEHFRIAFDKEGVALDRLELRAASTYGDLLCEYNDIDIALDPFPYNGGSTTCDALWMGVPVITLMGRRMISRQTASILSTVGYASFIADDWDDYIRIAVEWSGRLGALSELRKQLRQSMVSSSLCDAEEFTSDLENIYREIWGRWCCRV